MSTFTDLITTTDAFFLSLFTPVYTGSVAATMNTTSTTTSKKRKAEGEVKFKPSKHPKLTKTAKDDMTAKDDKAVINLTKSTVNRKKSGANQLTAKNGKDQGSTTTRPPWKPCWFYFLKNLNKFYFGFDV